jgi:hypothetical protein
VNGENYLVKIWQLKMVMIYGSSHKSPLYSQKVKFVSEITGQTDQFQDKEFFLFNCRVKGVFRRLALPIGF